jgi:hypothetical protein
MKIITIGRDSSCDIVINHPRVSRFHANMFRTNQGFTFKDMSSNGTYINGMLVLRKEIFINYGDSVLLACVIPLSWERVKNLLPDETLNILNNNAINIKDSGASIPSKDIPDNLYQWNWGAFFFGWFWAVCNGIYWPLIFFIPFFGLIADPIIRIILGINGSKWAWERRKWQSVEHFTRVQHNWAMAALWIFLGSIILLIKFVVIIILANV